MMKKTSVPVLILLLVFVVVVPLQVYGQGTDTGLNPPPGSQPPPGNTPPPGSTNPQTGASGGIQVPNFLGAKNFQDLLVKILNAMWVLAALLTILMVLISGFQFLFAAGNPEKIEKAKRTLLYVVIGFIIIVLSYSASTIIKSVTDTITGSSGTPANNNNLDICLQNPSLPQCLSTAGN